MMLLAGRRGSVIDWAGTTLPSHVETGGGVGRSWRQMLDLSGDRTATGAVDGGGSSGGEVTVVQWLFETGTGVGGVQTSPGGMGGHVKLSRRHVRVMAKVRAAAGAVDGYGRARAKIIAVASNT